MATVSESTLLEERPGPGVGLDGLRVCYEPFPIGICEEFVNPAFYQELLAAWPPLERFRSMPNLGKKYSLSEVNHSEAYHEYCSNSRPWKLFRTMVKQHAFVEYVLSTLRARNVDVGYSSDQLTARFEFSMLSGDGGHIVPHTDAAAKVVTLVIYFCDEQEWDDSWGGGTAILRAKHAERSFNRVNAALPFDQVETLHLVPYVPNTCLLFVKTFNSLHAVHPIRASSQQFRRSVTINLELPDHPTASYLESTGQQAKRFEL